MSADIPDHLIPSTESTQRLRAMGRSLLATADEIDRMIARSSIAHVNEIDALHTDLEEARARWWHRLIGVRWEITGWARR